MKPVSISKVKKHVPPVIGPVADRQETQDRHRQDEQCIQDRRKQQEQALAKKPFAGAAPHDDIRGTASDKGCVTDQRKISNFNS